MWFISAGNTLYWVLRQVPGQGTLTVPPSRSAQQDMNHMWHISGHLAYSCHGTPSCQYKAFAHIYCAEAHHIRKEGTREEVVRQACVWLCSCPPSSALQPAALHETQLCHTRGAATSNTDNEHHNPVMWSLHRSLDQDRNLPDFWRLHMAAFPIPC